MSAASQPLIDSPDYFNRDHIARNMGDMLVFHDASLISPAILCGSWGSGKSTHALRIKTYLEQIEDEEGVKCIYLDAFKCDHSEEPYGMILAALYGVAPIREQHKIIKAIKDNTLPYAKSIFKTILRSSIKNIPVVGTAVDQIITDVSNSEITKNLPELKSSEDFVKKELEAIQKSDERIESLKEIINNISKEKQIIFIIDELDRCRPDFAVDLLEKIKHIFDSNGIKFLLVMNKDQLLESIKHRYGLNDNMCKVYLDKFIRHEFSINAILTNKNSESNTNASLEYFNKLLIEKKLDAIITLDTHTSHIAYNLISKNNIQLREVERWIRNIALLEPKILERKSAVERDFPYPLFIESIIFSTFINSFCTKAKDQLMRSEWRENEFLIDLNNTISKNCNGALQILPSHNSSKKNALQLSFQNYHDNIVLETIEDLEVNGEIIRYDFVRCESYLLQDIYIYICYLNCVECDTEGVLF